MLDLREFGTRERVLGDVTDPLIPAQEADPQIVDTHNIVLSNANKAMKVVEAGRDDPGEEATSGARKNDMKASTRNDSSNGTAKSKMIDNKSRLEN